MAEQDKPLRPALPELPLQIGVWEGQPNFRSIWFSSPFWRKMTGYPTLGDALLPDDFEGIAPMFGGFGDMFTWSGGEFVPVPVGGEGTILQVPIDTSTGLPIFMLTQDPAAAETAAIQKFNPLTYDIDLTLASSTWNPNYYSIKSFDGVLYWIGDNSSEVQVLIRSEDSGASVTAGNVAASGYELRQFDIEIVSGRIWAIWIQTSSPFACSVYYSDDMGDNWTVNLTGLARGTQDSCIRCSPTDQLGLALVEINTSGSTYGRLRVSADRGGTWNSNDLPNGTGQSDLDPGLSPLDFSYQLRWLTNDRIVIPYGDDRDNSLIVAWTDDFGSSFSSTQLISSTEPPNAGVATAGFFGLFIDPDEYLYLVVKDGDLAHHIWRSDDGADWSTEVLSPLGVLDAMEGLCFAEGKAFLLGNGVIYEITEPQGSFLNREIIPTVAGSTAGAQDLIVRLAE